MKKTIGKFTYSIAKMSKSDNIPFSPFVHICLQNWSTDGRGGPRISAQLMTDCEIDEHVKLLKDDLDSVARRAKTALKKANDATLQIVSDRRTSQSDSNNGAPS